MQPVEPRASARWLEGSGALRGRVDGLLALCIEPSPAPPAGVLLPYDGFMLSIRLPQPRSSESRFLDSWLWPLRSRPDRYQLRGDGGTNLYAMLRPSAALALMRELASAKCRTAAPRCPRSSGAMPPLASRPPC